MDLETVAMIVLGLCVLAAMSAGIALGLHLMAPGWTERRRIMVAAGAAILAPASIPMAGFLLEADLDSPNDFLLGLMSLLVGTGAIWAVIGLPMAWWVTRRLAPAESRTDNVPALEDDAGQPLLADGQG